MPEGLSPAEVGKEIGHHREHAGSGHDRRDRILSISEAALLSVVAVFAAYSGYAAAKWGTESSLSLAKASATRTKANRAQLNALQIRTLDAVEFNPAFDALVHHDPNALRLAVGRMRPGYRVAFNAWLATSPLTNRAAPRGPAYMRQYRIPQQAQATALDARADEFSDRGEYAGEVADKYVRTTVFLATVLFLVGISSHFPLRAARYGLIGTACALLAFSLIQLLTLPGIP
jgi:hypothetical protein